MSGNMAGGTSGKKTSSFVNAYLIGYNAIETVGWTYLLYQLIMYQITKPQLSLYETLKYPLFVFQNAAVLEIVHAATGMVSSNPVLTTFQVFSRVMVVCGVILATDAAKYSVGFPLCLLAWSITEVIRYSTYTLSLMDKLPHFLKFLRYTLFIALYPIGITGELLCIYAAQAEVGKGRLYSTTMPNKYNFNFNYQYLLIFIMLLYIPLFPQLYLHMFSQRRKVLGGAKKD